MMVAAGSALLLGIPALLLGGSSGAGAVTANLPVFPNNINVFPNRDFVSIDSYTAHAGDNATVTVTRGGAVVGSATGVLANLATASLEINHPGGICWGAGGGLPVTPDIRAGDIVAIDIPADATAPAVHDQTTVQDAFANDSVLSITPATGLLTTLTVTGHIGPSVDRANLEQRIIEPLLVDTAIAKRDVRAVPGPMTPAPKGGYSSSLLYDLDGPDTFRATYIFDDPANAQIAANAALGERAMAWELTDAAANRQGMTIAENGELGGPGMGGCPMGPNQSGPPAPTNATAVTVAAGIQVNWTPAVAIPGTAAILGYEVTAVGHTSMPGNEQVQIGRRILNPTATTTTITGLSPTETYDIEIVSLSAVGKTFPALRIPNVGADGVPPVVSANPSAGTYPTPQSVTLTSNEPASQIFYTTDGSDPVTGPQQSISQYTAPIAVAATTTLKFVAYDPSNNQSAVVSATYTITNNPVPKATSFTTSSVGFQQVTLNWLAADPVLPATSIVNYAINVYASAAAVTPLQTVTVGNVLTRTITGLTANTPYSFTVSARNETNSSFGPESARLGPLTPQGLVVANAGPDQTGIVRGTVVTLNGAGSTAAATYSWSQVLDPAPRVTLSGGNTLTPSFTMPLYKYPMANVALTFQLTVTSAAGTISDFVVVTPASDVVTITSAKWKPGDLRVIGTASTVGAVVTVRSPSGQVFGVAQVTTAAAPATGGVYDFRLRVNVPPTLPPFVMVDSNRGGTAGPFPVSP